MQPLSSRHAPTLTQATLVGVPAAAFIGAGLVLVALIARAVWLQGPAPALLATALATLTAVPYALLVLWLDRHEGEPAPLVLLALAWGAMATACMSVLGRGAWQALAVPWLGPDVAEAWSSVVAAPVLEEALKGGALVALVVLVRHHVDGVLDGVVYGALVGVGFGWAENLLYYEIAALDGPRAAVELALVRGVVCGLGSHATFSALFGASLAAARMERIAWRRWLWPVAGAATAVAAHALWNALAPARIAADPDLRHLLLVTAPETALLLQGPFVLLTGLIVGLEWRHQDDLLTALLGQEPPDVVVPGDLAHLVPARRRVRRELQLLITAGPLAVWRHRRLTEALIDLAFARAHHLHDAVPWHADEDPDVVRLRRRVRWLRGRGVAT